MRKFTLIVISFFCIFFCCNLLLRFVYYTTVPLRLPDNTIENTVHTIVLGPSNGECAWNDSIIPNSRNLCFSAKSLGGCYSTLRWALEYNEAPIDTVVLCASLVAMAYQSDDNLLFWQEELNCFFEYGSLFNELKSNPAYLYYMVSSFPFSFFHTNNPGGAYIHLDRYKLDNPHLYDKVTRQINEAGGGDKFTEDYFRSSCKYQLNYLRKIRDYCEEHHKTLVILSTPVFKISDLIDDSGYRHLIHKELGDGALIADYSSFELPDSTYFGDLEHLNYRGADYFSNAIAQNGLKLIYATEYDK